MSRIFGEAQQIAWVVPDLDASMKYWAETLGIGPWFLSPHVTVEDFVCDGEPSDIDMSLAFAYSGGIQIELIEQHNDAPSLYADIGDRARGGQHHIGYFVRDYAERRQAALDAGLSIGQEGVIRPCSFAYFRTDRHLGTYSELILLNDQIQAGMDAQKAAARTWDGTHTVIDMSAL